VVERHHRFVECGVLAVPHGECDETRRLRVAVLLVPRVQPLLRLAEGVGDLGEFGVGL
jgi:hypothetical protein